MITLRQLSLTWQPAKQKIIDGNNAGVTVSMSLGGGALFLLGYEVQLLPIKKWTSDEIELRNSILNGRLLKDYFSDLKLDSSFKIK